MRRRERMRIDMKMTVGGLLFYGGISGLVISVVLLAAVLVYLKGMRKKMQSNLDENY